MSESNGEAHASTLPHSGPTPVPRGHSLLAWIAIAAIVSGVVYWQNFTYRGGAAGSQSEGVSLLIHEAFAKSFVAAPESAKENGDVEGAKRIRESMIRIASDRNHGSVDERLSALITLGELASPSVALKGIQELAIEAEKEGYELTPVEMTRVEILKRLYADYNDGRLNAPTVSPDERNALVAAYGWSGELALAPAGADGPIGVARNGILAEAKRTLSGVLIVLGAGITGLLVGFVGLSLMVIRGLIGRWKSNLGPSVAYHGIYAETFAIWIAALFLLFAVLPFAMPAVLPWWLPKILALLLSLGVLVWPVWRGIPWKQARQDIGLTLGTQPFLEPIYGIASYFHALPLLLCGSILTLLLVVGISPTPAAATNSFQTSPIVAHPALQQLARGSLSEIWPYYFLLAVCAPIVEEIFFRGVFYRHCRDATRGWRVSIFGSMIVVSVIFAAVHPQGVFAIPVLASLGCAFALAREWRGTLIPGIIAHGLSNAIMLSAVALCLMK